MALGITPQEIVDKSEYPLLGKAEHWERVALSDIASVQNGFAFKSSLFDRHEGMPLIRIRDICKNDTEHRYTGEYSQEFVVKSDDILIGMDGDFTASRWKGPNALLNQRVCRLSLLVEDIDEKFFFLCLQPYLNAINIETSSVTVKHLSSKTIGEIPLPLPPKKEQKRIVAKIEELFSELDKGIESLQTAREQLKVYRQAVLKHAFEGKLTEQWRKDNADKLESPEQLLARIQQERDTRYQQQLEDWKTAVKEWEANGKEGKKPGKPRESSYEVIFDSEELAKLPTLPDSWMWIPFNELISGLPRAMQSGPFGSNLKHSEFTTSGKLVIGIDNVRDGYFIYGSENRISEEKFQELQKYEARPGDLLITVMASLGRTCVVPRDIEQAIITKHVYRVTMEQSILYPEFYNHLLQSHTVSRLRMFENAQGQTRPGLNSTILKELPVPLCNIEEQKLIVSYIDEKLSGIESFENEVNDALKRAETLRQSILKKAFSGQLVLQDPNDEPATELLARIQAEKAALSAKAKKTPAKRGRSV